MMDLDKTKRAARQDPQDEAAAARAEMALLRAAAQTMPSELALALESSNGKLKALGVEERVSAAFEPQEDWEPGNEEGWVARIGDLEEELITPMKPTEVADLAEQFAEAALNQEASRLNLDGRQLEAILMAWDEQRPYIRLNWWHQDEADHLCDGTVGEYDSIDDLQDAAEGFAHPRNA